MKKAIVLLLALVFGLSLAALAIPNVFIDNPKIVGITTTVNQSSVGAPNGEFGADTIKAQVVIRNTGSTDVDLTGMTLHLQSIIGTAPCVNQSFYLPGQPLPAGGYPITLKAGATITQSFALSAPYNSSKTFDQWQSQSYWVSAKATYRAITEEKSMVAVKRSDFFPTKVIAPKLPLVPIRR